MCVIALAYKTPRLGPLLLLGNRDEAYARPASAIRQWDDGPVPALGGQDRQAGGSWLLVDARGRFAAVTNVRQGLPRSAALSRGQLVRDFVLGDEPVIEFARQLDAEREQYAPYNLLFGQIDDLYHYHSPTARLLRLTPGIHTLSNANLDTPWYKCRQLAEQLAALQRPPAPAQAFEWLADRTPAPRELLPNTGLGPAQELQLSSVFVQGRDYGTRASLLLNVGARGSIQMNERSYSATARPDGELGLTLNLVRRTA